MKQPRDFNLKMNNENELFWISLHDLWGKGLAVIGGGNTRSLACNAAICRLERLIGDVKKLAAKED